jgi:hypothetical protein
MPEELPDLQLVFWKKHLILKKFQSAPFRAILLSMITYHLIKKKVNLRVKLA